MRISDWSSDVCSSDLGAVEDLQLDASARGEIGTLDLSGSARKEGANWQGTLASLDLAPAKGATWHLQSPARYAQRGSNWTLSQSCFAASDGGALCASADWPRGGLMVEGQGLRSEETTSGLQALMRISYAVFICT